MRWDGYYKYKCLAVDVANIESGFGSRFQRIRIQISEEKFVKKIQIPMIKKIVIPTIYFS